ncbi:MAG: hypothetical protein QM638_02990 [Nocardioides sp.]|uniref:hypothetical protein n=1 Tax=Nocardioides sp. TaxID=35761 RepID=UPI0039E2FD36
MTATRLNAYDVVDRAEALGLTPAEWREIAAVGVVLPRDGSDRPIEPLSPQEWREAVLGALEEGTDRVLEP